MTCFACLSLRFNLTVRTSLAAESYTWYFLIVLRITIDCEVFCFRGFCRFFYISLFLWGAASEPYLYCVDLFDHISPLDTLALWVARILNPAILGLFALGAHLRGALLVTRRGHRRRRQGTADAPVPD